MKNTVQLPVILLLIALVSAGCREKKVIVMASGKLTVQGNTLSLEPDYTHTEKQLLVKEDEIIVRQGTTQMAIPVTEPGLYILNMKMDTLVGSYQRLGVDAAATRISREALRRSIDSLQLLITGANARPDQGSYFITPGKLVKITDNTDAEIIGPYRKMPGSFAPGRDYEIYKFSTNKEIRETLEKLKKL